MLKAAVKSMDYETNRELEVGQCYMGALRKRNRYLGGRINFIFRQLLSKKVKVTLLHKKDIPLLCPPRGSWSHLSPQCVCQHPIGELRPSICTPLMSLDQ